MEGPINTKETDEQGNEFVVQENDLKFIVNLSDYLDTGLFLDHRVTREMIRNESAGKKVLNLFAIPALFQCTPLPAEQQKSFRLTFQRLI